MSFDERGFADLSGGQINCDNAPWADRTHNCVPRSFSWAMAMLGYPDVDPELYTLAEYPGGNAGGESFQACIDFIKKHPDLYPNPPAFTISTYDADVAEAAGQAGKPMVISGSVDCPGVRFTPDGQCGHASVLLAHVDPDTFIIQNAWQGQEQNYSRADLTGLDSICVIERACGQGAVEAATAAHRYSPGGTDSSMAIIARPSEAGIYDLLVVGNDLALWHNYGTLADLAKGDRWHSWGGGLTPGSVSASWTPDEATLVISAQGPTGWVFVKEINRDGSVKTDWTRIEKTAYPLPGAPEAPEQPGPAGPQGVKGDPGTPGTPGTPGKDATAGGPTWADVARAIAALLSGKPAA